MDSEDIVLGNIVERQDYWHRPSITEYSQRRVQSGYPGDDSNVINKPVETGRALVDVALRVQNVDLMIRDRSMPEPDSGWVSRNSYQTAHLAHADIGPETVLFYGA